jgi:hypothetical protein
MAALPVTAPAETMDKAPGLRDVRPWSRAASCLGFVFWRMHLRLAPVAAPPLAAPNLPAPAGLGDPMGTAIGPEPGDAPASYRLPFLLSPALASLTPKVGGLLRSRARHAGSPAP